MVRLEYTYPRAKFMVMVPAHGHASAPHDCDHALMVAIHTELSHVTLGIYEKPPSRASNLEAFILYKQNCKIG